MNGEYQTIYGVIFTTLGFILQRTETKYRRLVLMTMLFFICPAVALFGFTRQAFAEGVYGLFIAALINGVFWLIIGRYNPVGSSDDAIKVYGMDD
jgi:F0F1-type ATP synthase assembly protein I